MPHSHLNLAKLRREIFDPEQHSMERMMHPSGDFLSTPELDYEGWRDALRPDWGRYNPEVVEPKTFAGRARPRSLFGFVAMDLSCNAHRVARTQRDVRLDGVNHYFALFSGCWRINDHSERSGRAARCGRCRTCRFGPAGDTRLGRQVRAVDLFATAPPVTVVPSWSRPPGRHYATRRNSCRACALRPCSGHRHQ